MKGKEIVLITGGSGFLGQHIVKLLQERDEHVQEIRIVDLIEYENRLGHSVEKKIVSYTGNICEPKTIECAFKNVDCVIHCVSILNFEYPANINKLYEINIEGTKNIINLCIKYNIPRLIYSSSMAVTFSPYMGRGIFCIIINQTENKAKEPTSSSSFLLGKPAEILYQTEKLILNANGEILENNQGNLKTVSLRSTIMYGEEDQKFVPTLLKISKKLNGSIPRLAGLGGKQQLTYVGNVAWGFVQAKNTLSKTNETISGLPVYITDDSTIEDTFRFCQRLSRATDKFKMNPSWWSSPALLTYFLAYLLELIFSLILYPLFKMKLNFTPTAIAAYTSSIFLYSRLRASIHLDYEPIYSEEKSIINSVKWYEKWLEKNDKKIE